MKKKKGILHNTQKKMSGFLDLESLECVADSCGLYNPDMWGSHIAIALDFYPIFLTFGIYVLSLYKYELYFALVSLSLTIGWIINFIIQRSLGETARFPDCGSPYQMPSFASQQIVTFETMMTLFMIVWGNRFKLKLIILLRTFTFGVLVSRIFLGINTTDQLLIGALMGFLLAILYHTIIYYIIFPYFGKILNWSLIRWLGLEDNMCGSSKLHVTDDLLHDKHPGLSKAFQLVRKEIRKIPKKDRPRRIVYNTDKTSIEMKLD